MGKFVAKLKGGRIDGNILKDGDCRTELKANWH